MREESMREETMKETEGLRGMTREGRKIEEREEAEMMRMNKQGRGREAERWREETEVMTRVEEREETEIEGEERVKMQGGETKVVTGVKEDQGVREMKIENNTVTEETEEDITTTGREKIEDVH